jgi:hypothetical protein
MWNLNFKKMKNIIYLLKLIKIGINLFVQENEEDNFNIFTNPNGNNIPPHFRWYLTQRIVNIILQYIRVNNGALNTLPTDETSVDQLIFLFIFFSVNIIINYLVENDKKLKKEEGDEEEFDS